MVGRGGVCDFPLDSPLSQVVLVHAFYQNNEYLDTKTTDMFAVVFLI